MSTEEDDIAIELPSLFRAERMAPDTWWVACYMPDGSEIVWDVVAHADPLRLEWRRRDA